MCGLLEHASDVWAGVSNSSGIVLQSVQSPLQYESLVPKPQ